MLKLYRKELQALKEAAEKKSTPMRETDSRVHCGVSIQDQIQMLMNTLPMNQQNRPWSMEELCIRISGKYHEKPHPMDVARALRRLGWESTRDWSRDGGGRRLWIKKPLGICAK